MNEIRSFELLNYYMHENELISCDEALVMQRLENKNCWQNICEKLFINKEYIHFDKFLVKNKFISAIEKFNKITGLEAYNQYLEKCDEILENKMAEYGVYPIKFEGHNVYGIDVILYDENYKKACEEAEQEAKEELSFSSKFCEVGFWGRLLDL